MNEVFETMTTRGEDSDIVFVSREMPGSGQGSSTVTCSQFAAATNVTEGEKVDVQREKSCVQCVLAS